MRFTLLVVALQRLNWRFFGLGTSPIPAVLKGLHYKAFTRKSSDLGTFSAFTWYQRHYYITTIRVNQQQATEIVIKVRCSLFKNSYLQFIQIFHHVKHQSRRRHSKGRGGQGRRGSRP